MKKHLALALALILLTSSLLLSACSSAPGDDSSGSGEGDKPSIAAIFMALNSDYWHMIEAGCINGGRDFGFDVRPMGPTAETDVTGQISMIEDQIAAGVDGIILAPCEPKAVVPVLEKAKEKGIPVVMIDGDLEEENQDLRATFIGSSEYEAGQQVGEYIVENFEPCDIAIVRGVAGATSHTARQDGCKEIVEAAGFKVVTIQPADSERGKAVNVTENILESSPDVKIIYATNDEMALGAYQAVEGKQMQDDVFIIGFDGSPDALKSIKEGKLDASLAQKPIDMGYKGVEAIKTLLEGGTVENRIYTPTEIIDSSNVEEFEAALNAQLEEAEG